MYSTSTASTTSGSRALPAGSERRVRAVRLLRPRRSAPAFGFSLRGGREYSTGFFVSKVEFNSEAHLQGLKVGDQLITVNGYRVEDAVHGELVHYLASQSRLKLKVRYVGMVPIKEKAHESVSWQLVSERAGSEVSSSPTLCHDTDRLADLRLSILVPPRAKLGCGICKGPEWKPGIFVQFVREGGIAREAGLRPGDQIMSCNGQDFANVTFNEAISAMKACGRLELVIREGAGVDLVSPESSGYNSSASSAAGERSPAPPAPAPPLAPPAALRRRLASVAEEAADRADRLTMSRLKRRTWDSLDYDWKTGDIHNFDAPSDIEPDYDCPSIPNNPHTYESKNSTRPKSKEYVSTPSNRTIINLTEDGATIQCSYDTHSQAPKTYTNATSRESEKKTIVVEVHHTSGAGCQPHCYPPPAPAQPSADAASVASSASLSSAIADEIQRRRLNKKSESRPEVKANPAQKPNISKIVEDPQKKQHAALMDEFKKVHRKMFANQDVKTDEISNKTNGLDETDADSLDRQQTLPLRKVEQQPQENGSAKHHQQQQDTTDNAPPPPPMPTENGHQNGQTQPPTTNGYHNGHVNGDYKNGDHKFTPKKMDNDLINSIQNGRKNGTILRTPTPDYNNHKAEANTKARIAKDEKAEMESLESFKLKNPSSVQPKPPGNYFVRAPNGTATMKKHVRPVSVTIGEYAGAGAGARREPSKLEFLGERPAARDADDLPITNRLQSELVMTLSRSNLRKKTDTLNHAVNMQNLKEDNFQEDSTLDRNFHARYGNNLLPLPPSITIPKVSKLKH